MSYFGAMLMLYLDPEVAFVAMANIVNTHFFRSLFKMNIDQVPCEMMI